MRLKRKSKLKRSRELCNHAFDMGGTHIKNIFIMCPVPPRRPSEARTAVFTTATGSGGRKQAARLLAVQKSCAVVVFLFVFVLCAGLAM